MPFIRTGFGPVLLAIQARIVEKVGIPINAVKLIGRDPEKAPQLTGQKDILLRPAAFINSGQREVEWSSAAVYLASMDDAAGRLYFHLARELIIFPRMRMLRDQADRDDIWMTHPTDGFFAFEEQIMGALEDWFPKDKDGNEITPECIKLVKGTDAEKKVIVERGQHGEDKEMIAPWGYSALSVAVHYVPPIEVGEFGTVED